MICFVFFVLAAAGWVVSRHMTDVTSRRSAEHVRAQSMLVIGMIDAYNNSIKTHTELLCRVFAASCGREVVQKIDGRGRRLLVVDGTTLNGDTDRVDRFTETTGAVATVFVLDGGDFTRISTSLRKKDGARAVGTVLGREHPAHPLLVRSEAYTGRASLFGKEYMTAYMPVRDVDGRVVGAYFVGIDFTTGLRALNDKIAAVRFGKTGSMQIIDASGEQGAAPIVFPAIPGSDENICKTIGCSPEQLIQMISVREGALVVPSRESGGSDALIAWATYADWNWLVVARQYSDEVDRGTVTAKTITAVTLAAAVVVISAVTWLLFRSTEK